MYIDTFEARKQALEAEKTKTAEMNSLTRAFISRALIDEYRTAPNPNDHDEYYCGILTLQALKNFVGRCFDLSRETAEVMLEASFFHYLQRYDTDKAEVKKLAQRLRELECDSGRKKRMWGALHSTYTYVEPWPRASGVSQVHKMPSLSEF